jgi:hypothetical protein
MNSRFNRKSRKEAKKSASKEIITDAVDMELFIDHHDLNNEVMNQPLLLRKWTKLKSEAHTKAKILKLQLKELESKFTSEYSKKGYKVKEVEAAVCLEPKVQKMQRDLIEAEETLESFEGIVRAFFQRHEALKELGANIRKELLD